jgi:hypothetical protein
VELRELSERLRRQEAEKREQEVERLYQGSIKAKALVRLYSVFVVYQGSIKALFRLY